MNVHYMWVLAGIFLTLAKVDSSAAPVLPEFKSAEHFKRALESASTPLRETGVFYTGKMRDDQLGYLFAYRNYDAGISRWTACDPSGFPDGANSYAFCTNRVTMGIDPNGLEFLCYDGSTLTKWSGSGWQSDGSVDWGTAGESWAATSGGAESYAPIPGGWWNLTAFMAMGGVEPGFYPEKTVTSGDIKFAGTMSSWDRMTGTGYGGYDAPWSTNRLGYDTTSGGTAPTVSEYKIGLEGIHGNTNTINFGARIHPTMAGQTHGCVGITNYADAVSFKTFITNKMDLDLLVE